MKLSKTKTWWRAMPAVFMIVTGPAWAVDGVVLFNQSAALAGNITPGDTPGFPVTLSMPGSYRLTSNLIVGDVNTIAVFVTGDDVTIDLNGFSIIGPTVCTGNPVTSCTPTGFGAGIEGPGRNTRVFNGTIRGMGFRGISLNNDSFVEKVHAINIGAGDIAIFAETVNACSATQNGGQGIAGTLITNSKTVGNGGSGIIVFGSAINNVAIGNGSQGISATCPSAIVSNSASGNRGGDIVTSGSGCTRANNAPLQ
jgi:hypothetical protein